MSYQSKRRTRDAWPSVTDPRWSDDLGACEAQSKLSAVWLEIAGAATPILFEKPLTAPQCAAMGVQRWARSLVTDDLSAREMQVFVHWARGLGPTEISRAIFVCLKTVVTYCTRIRDKTGLRNQVEVAIYAYRHNLVTWAELPSLTDTSPPPSSEVLTPAACGPAVSSRCA